MTRFPAACAALALALAVSASGCSVLDVATRVGDLGAAVRPRPSSGATAQAGAPSPAATATATPSVTPSGRPIPTLPPTVEVALPKADIGGEPDVEALRRALVEASFAVRSAAFHGTITTEIRGTRHLMVVSGGYDRHAPEGSVLEAELRVAGEPSFSFIQVDDTIHVLGEDGYWETHTAQDLARAGVMLPQLDYAADLNRIFTMPGSWTYEGSDEASGPVPLERYRLTMSEADLMGTTTRAAKKNRVVVDYSFDAQGRLGRVVFAAPSVGVSVDMIYHRYNENLHIEVPR
ncbi:hypothetical protein G7070_13615 [Propioniciclava coleopterorum]|uniref:Lipoprotein LprG n=1 Tax=Propioniciclava coleopterorum TaxID=2714937 RepID=A0A6G7Y8K5_9ACTN|nr:hypothetical protein [Propioniciclava coleopterorum]QIK73110.1 hypothetical protein G7070_13615 [Propioniciclava coleopterorum]